MRYQPIPPGVGNAVRLVEVVSVLMRHGFADLVRRLHLHESLPAKALRKVRLVDAHEARPDTFGSRLRRALTELGPTFIKFGQLLSTRPDLVDEEICEELGLLLDQVPPQDFEKLRPTIEESLGRPIEEVFAEFNQTPIASASLSQVYRGKLKNGLEVAVKVKRPHVERIISKDIRLLKTLAAGLKERVSDMSWVDPEGTVEQFERSVRRELDFSIEARVIESFRANFAETPEVFIPRAFVDISDANVLVMDWIDGVRIDRLADYEARNSSPLEVARLGARIVCMQVFEHRLFHADPHPANVYLTRNNQIAFLDYGMAGHLEQEDSDAIASLLYAIMNRDAQGCVEAIEAFTQTQEVEREEMLAHDVSEVLAFEAATVVGEGQVGRAIGLITSLLRRYQLQLAPRFSLLLKSLATVEATARKLDPEMDMLPIIQPYVEDMIVRRHSPMRMANELRRQAVHLLRLGQEMPMDVRGLLRMLRKGRFRVQLEHEDVRKLANATDRASNRVAFGVICGSLIIGSSTLLSTDVAGGRVVGYIGYIIATLLGLGLVISIIRSQNY